MSQNAEPSFFSEFSLSHNYEVSDKWTHKINGTFKQFYAKSDWNRLSGNLTSTRKFSKQWNVDLGFLANYTYDPGIENYWELRPSVDLHLKNDVVDNLSFSQKVKFEWRNLLFTNGSPADISTRVRYKISPNYVFHNKNEERNWSSSVSLEWYFISDKDVGERFNNTREINLTIGKDLKKDHRFTVGYTHEEFNENFNPDGIGGNTLNLTYTF